MPKAFEMVLSGELAATARMRGVKERLDPLLIRNLNVVNTQLQRYIVSGKLSGQILKSHTGNLKRGIIVIPATTQGTGVVASVGLSKEAWYGLAHEFGAHIPERVPVNAKALHWIGANGIGVFAMRARAFELPERSFLRTSFVEFRPRIENAIATAVQEAV